MSRFVRVLFLPLAGILFAGILLLPAAHSDVEVSAAPGPAASAIPTDAQDLGNLICAVPSADSSDLLPCHAMMIRDYQPPMDLPALVDAPCLGGMSAGFYPCRNVDLLSFLPLGSIGGGSGADIWGWTDPDTGREYALLGRTNGTAFVDISDPRSPLYLGNLPTSSSSSIWRDVKTIGNYLVVVADSAANHGMQVFDLTRLRSVAGPPVLFSADVVYDGIGSAHNVVVNEGTGFVYIVGGSSGGNQCSGGLHMVDMSNPLNPTFAGCYAGDGYTHDAQCVVYQGPDADYQGREICFNANTDTLTIVDVDNKSTPQLISRTGYSTSGYTHQGWLTEDQRYYLMDDELDEGAVNTRTYIWDLLDLDDPQLIGTHVAETAAIDHNMYIKDGLVYQANYRAGLRILDAAAIASGTLTEIGYFDIYPASDSANFNGAWSSYPYFESGVVVVSGIEQGLYVLRHGASAARLFLPAVQGN